MDLRMPPPSKGSGPRLFCGHVPKEATEDLVKAHFSRWGLVTDVYFPRHKKTLKRRPFCFVTFASRDSAERALAESPLNICGIPIKNLTMVEDRDKYYKDKHAAARQALLAALGSCGVAGPVSSDQVNNIAALLAMEGTSVEQLLATLLPGSQAPQQPQTVTMPGYAAVPPMSQPQHQFYGGPPNPADIYLLHQHQQQQQQQQQRANEHAAVLAAMARGTLPGPRPGASGGLPFGPAQPNAPSFNSAVHRDPSMSSLSSASDWISTTSSARNSLDLPAGLFGQPPPQPHHQQQQQGPSRRSFETAAQLRQQLLAQAGSVTLNSNPYDQGAGGVNMSGGAPGGYSSAQWGGQMPQQQPAVMQSAFYQSASMLPAAQTAMTTAGMMLPPIREGRPAQAEQPSWQQGGQYVDAQGHSRTLPLSNPSTGLPLSGTSDGSGSVLGSRHESSTSDTLPLVESMLLTSSIRSATPGLPGRMSDSQTVMNSALYSPTVQSPNMGTAGRSSV